MNNKKMIGGIVGAIIITVILVFVIIQLRGNGAGTDTTSSNVNETNYFDKAKTFEGDGDEADVKYEKVTNEDGEVQTNKNGEEVTKIVSSDADKDVDEKEENDNNKSDKNSSKKNKDTKKKSEKAKKDNKNSKTKKDKKDNKDNTKEKDDDKEAYPGEDEGWSPIVSPEELEQ